MKKFWKPPFHLNEKAKKLILTMKLTVFILFLTLMQVSATVYSQATRFSFRAENKQVVEVLRQIEEKSDFRFFFLREQVDVERKVTVTAREATVEQILEELFRGQPVSYEFANEALIVLTRGDNPLGSVSGYLLGNMQQPAVSGTVTDESGQPLPGVTVLIKGTTQGTVTNTDGNYSLTNIPDDAMLVFSFVGMRTLEIVVGNQTRIDLRMEEETFGLEEVVAIGYGTQKKVNLTGAVDVISNQQIENRQAATVSQILQGQMPGLNFSIGNYGFQPGAQLDIEIRGMGSINGGSPYVLIDGFPGDMDRLNPEDINSISVLKDAAASAIYGARAPYGVILITTKSGNKNERLSATYSGSVSINTPQRLPKMLDSYTYARVLNEAGVNRGGRPFSESTIERIIAYQNGDIDFLKQFMPDDVNFFETIPMPNGFWGFSADANANYDWFDEYYGSSINQKHNFSFQGGSDKSSYYFSAGYLDQSGVLNYGTDTYQRVNVNGKINTSIANWWDFRYEPRLMKSNRIMPNMDRQGDYDLIFHQIARTFPNDAKYDGYGNITIQSKIPWVNDAGTDNIETTENWHTFTTEIRPTKDWKINADFAYRSVDQFRSDQELTVYDHRVDRSPVASGNTVPSNIQQFHYSNYYWTSNTYTSYNINFNDQHNFYVLVGTQFEYDLQRNMVAIKNDLIVPEVPSLETAIGDPTVTEFLSHWSTQGYFGRFTYNYREKYLLESNVRYDGTSKFRSGKRWGFFPSFSIGWNVHKELFWHPLENIINTFKLRGSYGQLGNQNVNAYQDLELIPLESRKLNWLFGGARPVGYTSTPNLISSSLTWETSATKNFGANMTFLNGKLQADFDWFERLTTNMIGPSETKPGVLGANVPRANNATFQTRGWEFLIKWKQDLKSGLSYFANFNVFDNTSVIKKYLNPTGILSTWYEGQEVGEIWGYTAYDLYRSQPELDAYLADHDLTFLSNTWYLGDVKYEDINGDGKVNRGANTLDDHGDLSIIGNNTPRFQFGISAGLNFKGFDFSMLWKGTAKRDLFFDGNQNIFWGFRTWNQSSVFPWHLDYYRDQPGNKFTGLNEGDANININGYWPRPYLHAAENNKNRQTNTLYLVDGSFLRLQNIQLGYSLKTKMVSRLNLQNVRIYLSGENLLTITDLPRGIDPVAIGSGWGTGKTYGADRIFSLGLIITY